MEVEVWSCPTRRQREEDVNHVPGSDDTLLGTAYVPLQALCHTETIGYLITDPLYAFSAVI